MSRPDDALTTRLRAARPVDPGPREAEAAAVRVLARVAVLEAGARGAVRARRGGRGRALVRRAAAVLLGASLVGLGGLSPATAPEVSSQAARAPVPATAGPEGPWAQRVHAALAGDPLAQRRVVHGGLRARRALLTAAEARARQGATPQARLALGLLAEAGRLRGEDESRRVAALAGRDGLRPAAVGLLATSLGPYGARALQALLVEDHAAETAVVTALLGMARRGRREPALQALLAGTERGRVEAAAAALRVAGAADVTRVLAALPPEQASVPEVLQAVRAGPVTLRKRLVRLAEHGDGRALTLAAAARVEGVVARLGVESQSGQAARARRAVDLLTRHGGLRAQLALARAFEGLAGARARAAVRAAPASLDQALLAHARGALRDVPAVTAALAQRGAGGVATLRAMAADARLAPRALQALARTAAPEAVEALASLAARRGLASAALAALGRRLAAGDEAAGQRLLALVGTDRARAAVQALRGSGRAGRALLESPAGRRAVARRAARGPRSQGRTARSI